MPVVYGRYYIQLYHLQLYQYDLSTAESCILYRDHSDRVSNVFVLVSVCPVALVNTAARDSTLVYSVHSAV